MIRDYRAGKRPLKIETNVLDNLNEMGEVILR